ncbi:hypothetical protein M3C33_004690 [Micrococcus luteus]|nr:hypothetical protein [Micrococcus luteus]MCV7688476.1 hypothetical protein [Micrococcus luteus]
MDTPQDPPHRDDPSGGPVEPAVDAALDRVRALLRQARGTAAPDAPTALDARGWWELSLEAALRDEPRESARLADSGLAALVPGQDDVRLALLRALAVAAGQVGDEAALTRWVEARAALLRHLGRPRQAGLESQLGAALVRDPDTVEAAVLAGVVEDEPGAPGEDPGDTVLPEAALALAVHRVHTGDLDAALELARRVIAVLGGLRAAGALLPTGSWSSAHLLLARLHLWRGEHAEADAAAAVVTALPAARAVLASATTVRAIAAHELDRPTAALDLALEAAERMASVGLRRGAASAAALAGRVAGDLDGYEEVAVAAWELASVHAEKAEAPEASSLSYWWAHQLVLAGRADEAEPLLARLVRREATHGRDVEQARALVDLGHAHHDQDRAENALPLWREAAGLFEAHGQWEDAARTLLAAGALVNRERDERTRPSALDLFERAVAAARQAVDEDPAVLPAALHAHGYLLCESGQAEGLDLLEEALALVRDAGADWQVADYTDTRARALWSLERGPEAIATALQAADLFTAAGDREGAAQAELFAAYVVAEDGSPEQAATLFRLVCESTESTLVRLGALTGLHQCLSALGDHDGAARVRDELDALREGLGAD